MGADDEEKISFKCSSSNGYILKKALFTKMKIMSSKTRTFVNKEKTSLKYSEQTTLKILDYFHHTSISLNNLNTILKIKTIFVTIYLKKRSFKVDFT